jgi:hypothetical protein
VRNTVVSALYKEYIPQVGTGLDAVVSLLIGTCFAHTQEVQVETCFDLFFVSLSSFSLNHSICSPFFKIIEYIRIK